MVSMSTLSICLHLLLSSQFLSATRPDTPIKKLKVEEREVDSDTGKEISPTGVNIKFSPIEARKPALSVFVEDVSDSSESDESFVKDLNEIRISEVNPPLQEVTPPLQETNASPLQEAIKFYTQFLAKTHKDQIARNLAFANETRGQPSSSLSITNQVWRLARLLRRLTGAFPQPGELFKAISGDQISLSDAIDLAELYALLDHPKLAHQVLRDCQINNAVAKQPSNDLFTPKATGMTLSLPLLFAHHEAYKLLELYLQDQVEKNEEAKQLARHELHTLTSLLPLPSSSNQQGHLLQLYRQAHNLLE